MNFWTKIFTFRIVCLIKSSICRTIENTSLEQYDRVMNVNVRAIYQLTMSATPELIKTQGNIVNISSVNGIRSFPGVLAYNISKAALDQFTRCIALELAPKQVRVNSVNPGVTITELQKRGGLSDEKYGIEKFGKNLLTFATSIRQIFFRGLFGAQ